MPHHLFLAISSHGYGHAGQLAPVVAGITENVPAVHVTVASDLPSALLGDLFGPAITIVPPFEEVTMVMGSAIDVLAHESAEAYAASHEHWDLRVNRAAHRLAELAPDLLVADVPYLPLAAAARLGQQAIALSSLNWADIYRAYCGERPEAPRILDQMLSAYGAAQAFLTPEPCLPMADLDTTVVGPVARLGGNRRAALDEALGCPAGERLVLVTLGGMDFPLDFAAWPSTPGWCWIVPPGSAPGRRDICAIDSLKAQGFSFMDILRSVDAFVTKPGYGGFVEAGCNGVPVLYVRRGDWPEEPGLTA